jgi:hypothetical protein
MNVRCIKRKDDRIELETDVSWMEKNVLSRGQCICKNVVTSCLPCGGTDGPKMVFGLDKKCSPKVLMCWEFDIHFWHYFGGKYQFWRLGLYGRRSLGAGPWLYLVSASFLLLSSASFPPWCELLYHTLPIMMSWNLWNIKINLSFQSFYVRYFVTVISSLTKTEAEMKRLSSESNAFTWPKS